MVRLIFLIVKVDPHLVLNGVPRQLKLLQPSVLSDGGLFVRGLVSGAWV